MTLSEAHYAFKLNMDRVDKASSLDFNTLEIDWILNEAQLTFVKQRLGRFPSYEVNQKRTDDLSSLHVKYPLQGIITPTLLDGVYEIKLNSLDYKYLRLLRGTTTAKKSGCTYSVGLKFSQTDDLNEIFKDPFNSPSIDNLPYNFGTASDGDGTSIYIYPGDLEVEGVKLEYIRYPKRIHFGNYTYIDGTTPTLQSFELSEETHDEIVNLATQLTSLIIENPEYIQLKERKIQIQE
jgi:hypothetical protein